MVTKRPYRHKTGHLEKLLTHSVSPIPPIYDAPSRFFEVHSFAEGIIESIYEPIIILDNSLTIIAANKAFYKNFTYTRKSIIKQNISTLMQHDPHIKILVHKLQSLTEKQTKLKAFEFQYKDSLGDKSLIINTNRISLGKQKTNLILLTIRDITQQKLLEQQKDDFVGYVSHELKTPITSAYAFIQILQGYYNKTGDKKSQFLIAKVIVQIQRLTNILNSFTSVYKAQTGKLQIIKKPFNINDVIHDVLETFQYIDTKHSIVVEGKITHPLNGDPDKIREALINLITNAIKYSPKADKIILILEENDKEITISVKDFGFGLNASEKEKVFQRFYRVKGKKDYHIEGLGLGLYLTAAIVHAHNGEIWVNSKEKEGSIFSFSLPIYGKTKLAIS